MIEYKVQTQKEIMLSYLDSGRFRRNSWVLANGILCIFIGFIFGVLITAEYAGKGKVEIVKPLTAVRYDEVIKK
jgi:hypothetical protein